MNRLRLAKDAVGPVARGHPWVYADGVVERPPRGTIVQLTDGRDRPVAWGIADDGPIAVRVLGRHPEPIRRLLERRLSQAIHLRQRVVPADTNAYRLVNGAGDGLPGLVLDRYDSVIVIRLYSGAWEPHIDPLIDVVRESTSAKTIIRKFGVRNVDGGKSGGELLSGDPLPERLVIKENGLYFRVRPLTGQKTGFFLDQRANRAHLGQRANGIRVSNLFAYTGGFGVYAAAGGATHVVSVDIAPGAIEDAKENFRLNGLDPSKHEFVVADVFDWTPAETQPELLICDPPSLTHGKRSDVAAKNAYRDLATRCGNFIRTGGMLATFSCTARMDQARWMQAVRDGLRRSGRWALLWQATEPPDHPVALEHPEGRYLKFSLFRRM